MIAKTGMYSLFILAFVFSHLFGWSMVHAQPFLALVGLCGVVVNMHFAFKLGRKVDGVK